MKVVALETWTNGSITMEEKQVADIPDDLAEKLIEKGIVAESPEYYGGGSGGDVLVVTESELLTLDHTWQEIHDAMLSGGAVISANDGDLLLAVTDMTVSNGTYYVEAGGANTHKLFSADSASGYPAEPNK